MLCPLTVCLCFTLLLYLNIWLRGIYAWIRIFSKQYTDHWSCLSLLGVDHLIPQGEAHLWFEKPRKYPLVNWFHFILYVQLDDLSIPVSEGQYFGFSWSAYGIVSFNWGQRPRTGDPTNGRFYRGAQSPPQLGQSLTLGWSDFEYWDGHNYRDYAFWVTYCCK